MFGLIPWKRTQRHQQQLSPAEWNDPWETTLSTLREEMDRLFDRFFGSQTRRPLGLLPWEGWLEGLEDRGDHYRVRLPVPGFEPEEFDVSVSGNRLILRAEHKEESKEGNGGYRFGSLHEVITLPESVDVDQIEARYHNGVLEVRLPKREEARPKRIVVKG